MSKLEKEIRNMVQEIIDEPLPEPDGVCIVLPAEVYDFDFITRSLGLIPFKNDQRALNVGAIVIVERNEQGNTCFTLHGGEIFTLSPEEMIELEATIKRRAEEAKQIQRETFKENIIANHEALRELNNRVQPGMIVDAPVGKRGRQ